MGLLDGKVALITGAGGGLGRAYAILYAKEGAKVVVNDLGGDRSGDGSDPSMADKVVAEIKENGGEAIANHGSVCSKEDAQSMVDDAINAFGTLDIVINNAGVLRDKTFVKMTDEMFDMVVDVHLRGTYLVTKAAFPALAKSGSGTVINTSSYSGLKGNFGQSNYAAAKAGIAGLTRSLGIEGRKLGINVNAIAPVAKTRMTDELAAVPSTFEPEDIAPLVCWLGSEEAKSISGRIFGAHGSHYFEWFVDQTNGVDLGAEQRWKPSDVGRRFGEITALEEKANPVVENNPQLSVLFEQLPATFKADRAGSWNAKLVFDVGGTPYSLIVENGKSEYVPGTATPTTGTIKVDEAKTLLELAAGRLDPQQAFMKGKMSTDNMEALMKFAQCFDLGATNVESVVETKSTNGLNVNAIGRKYRGEAVFVEPSHMQAYAAATEDGNSDYEGKDAVAPPMFSVKPLRGIMLEALLDPELNVDASRLVHGEQDMYFHRQLRPWDLVAPRSEIGNVEENSGGQSVQIDQKLMFEGQPAVEITSKVFIRSNKTTENKVVPGPNTGDLLFEESQAISTDLIKQYAAASDDKNPLHVDEQGANTSGFPSVISHGLCTMAFAGRAIINGVCGEDTSRLKRLKVRFSKPVLPGWTLTTRIWQGKSSTEFEFIVVNQDGVLVIKDGLAEISAT